MEPSSLQCLISMSYSTRPLSQVIQAASCSARHRPLGSKPTSTPAAFPSADVPPINGPTARRRTLGSLVWRVVDSVSFTGEPGRGLSCTELVLCWARVLRRIDTPLIIYSGWCKEAGTTGRLRLSYVKDCFIFPTTFDQAFDLFYMEQLSSNEAAKAQDDQNFEQPN